MGKSRACTALALRTHVRIATHTVTPPATCQQGGADPFGHTTVEPGGTTMVVLCAGGGGLLLLTHPARLKRIASESVTMRIIVPP
jgi:hypothetical protein